VAVFPEDFFHDDVAEMDGVSLKKSILPEGYLANFLAKKT
jgi:hypothetical protein